uniref:RRM domain-containing protein n=1 Tax=Alexandrium monilatum TaxID=311494 RepID=A0A6T1HGT2_9DINO
MDPMTMPGGQMVPQGQMGNMMGSMMMPMMYVPMGGMQQGEGMKMPMGSMQMTPALMGQGSAGAGTAAPTGAGESKLAKYQKLVRRKQKDNANVVFVGGLRKTTEEDRVCAHFAKFGQVEHVDIKRLPDGTSRGFAFIKFADIEAVDKVIEAHAKHMIDNKWVEVKRHDGMAACAGMASSLQKKVEEETPAPKEPNQEDWSEQWSEQYLAMASQLGQMQQQQQGPGGSGDPASMIANMMGMTPEKMKNMGMDPAKMASMMGDPSKMMSARRWPA